MSSLSIRSGPKVATTLPLLVRVFGAATLRADSAGQSMTRALPHAEMAKGETAPAQASWENLVGEVRKLRDQARYADAEQCLRSAAALAEDFRSTDPRVAETLNALATVVQIRGRYDEAENLYQQALAIWTQHPGEHGLNLAVGLSNLAKLLRVKGQYPESGRLQLQAIDIETRSALAGRSDPFRDTLWAGFHTGGGWPNADADVTFRQVLATPRRVFGPDDPTVAKRMATSKPETPEQINKEGHKCFDD